MWIQQAKGLGFMNQAQKDSHVDTLNSTCCRNKFNKSKDIIFWWKKCMPNIKKLHQVTELLAWMG